MERGDVVRRLSNTDPTYRSVCLYIYDLFCKASQGRLDNPTILVRPDKAPIQVDFFIGTDSIITVYNNGKVEICSTGFPSRNIGILGCIIFQLQDIDFEDKFIQTITELTPLLRKG